MGIVDVTPRNFTRWCGTQLWW